MASGFMAGGWAGGRAGGLSRNGRRRRDKTEEKCLSFELLEET